MKIGLTSYSLNADIMSGRKTILDAMRFAAENGAEHMEIVPFGFTLYDDGRDEFNQPLIDSIRQTAEALSLPLSDYAVLANLLAPDGGSTPGGNPAPQAAHRRCPQAGRSHDAPRYLVLPPPAGAEYPAGI